MIIYSIEYNFIFEQYDFMLEQYDFIFGQYDFMFEQYDFIFGQHDFIFGQYDFMFGQYGFIFGQYGPMGLDRSMIDPGSIHDNNNNKCVCLFVLCILFVTYLERCAAKK